MPGSLAARDISKSYAAVQVLDRVSLVVSPGDRIGIVGSNGIGKTTLLRVLAGLEQPDAGSVVRTGAVGYLPQESTAEPGETVLAYLSRRVGVAGGAGDPDFEAQARRTLKSLGLAGRTEDDMAALSGGEATRVDLAGILLARFDVFLLDEPTNNLDFDGLARLERFLDGLRAGVVLVSHDRAFLDRTITRVLELEAETRRTHEYAGTWSDYERARAIAREQHERAYADYAETRDRYSTLLVDRRNQARAGASIADRRGTQALRSKVKQARRLLERLDTVDKPWSPWQLQLSLGSAPPTGLIAELRGAVVERGSFRLGPVDLALHWGDRVAVVGANGSGKTTLLGALLGELPLVAGSRRVGPAAVFGELEQGRTRFGGILLDDFAAASGLAPTEARTLLAKFALGADDVERRAPSLSPGERTRAALALFAARGVNCLVLDEPTNHLDLEAIEELETGLEDYDGCLVVVTHDRRFLERLAVSRTVSL